MGRIAPERVRIRLVPQPPDGVVAVLASLDGGTELISDVLDDLGIPGVVSASVLKPTIAGVRIVGPALTVRNIRLPGDPYTLARAGHINRQADFEAHNLTHPGDVIVIQGCDLISNMGGISATMSKRQGGAGAIIAGGIRDVGHSRTIGYPIWSTSVTAVSGKWRMETMEINGTIEIGGIQVAPGDIVVADDSAVCFVPRNRAAEVAARAQRKAAVEVRYFAFLASGRPLADFPRPDPTAEQE